MLLDALFPRTRAQVHGKGDVLERFLSAGLWGSGGRTRSGVEVDEDSALTYAAWWCGCRVLAEAVSSLPLLTYRRLAKDDREIAGNHWLFDLLWRQPNPDMASGPFREGRVLHQINWGNGFAEIEWDSMVPERRTRALALWPIHASRVRPVSETLNPEVYRQGFRYLVRNNDGTDYPLMPDEVLHVPGIFPEDGVWGKSAVLYHKETLGFGLATERHGAQLFSDGAQPVGIVTGMGMRNKDARDNFRREWKEIHANTSEIAILPDNAGYTPITMSNEAAQYLETRKMNVAQVARVLRIPVYMLEEYAQAASYASVEQRGIDFIVYSLMPWLRRWEEQIHLKLILPRDRDKIFVEHLLAGLLRGDFASRMAGYVQALNNGIMTINEVRRLENLNSIGRAGDQNYVQLNMTTAEKLLTDTEKEPDPPPPQFGPPQEPPADPTEDEQQAAVEQLTRRALTWQRNGHYPVKAESVRLVLTDSLGRAANKLANALKREAGKVTDLAEWLGAFCAEYGPGLSDALEPAAAALGRSDVAGMNLWAIAARKAGADLAAAFDTLSPAKFAEYLTDWPRRVAGEIAAELMQEEPNHAH